MPEIQTDNYIYGTLKMELSGDEIMQEKGALK